MSSQAAARGHSRSPATTAPGTGRTGCSRSTRPWGPGLGVLSISSLPEPNPTPPDWAAVAPLMCSKRGKDFPPAWEAPVGGGAQWGGEGFSLAGANYRYI